MTTDKTSLLDRAQDPVIQAALALAGVLAAMLLSKFIQLTELAAIPARFPWLIAASFILCFSMFNSILSLFSESMMKYWRRSIYSFLGLAVISGLAAWLFSSLSIDEAGSFRWIFFVLTFGYLVFLSLISFMRRIIEFAQREEWNHPRIRRRKKK